MATRILGVHELAKPTVTAAAYPAAAYGREFVAKPGGGPLPETTNAGQLVKLVDAKVRPHLAAGGGCVVSIKVDMVSVSKGRWDERLRAVGAALAGLPVIVLLWHEPEDDLMAGAFVLGHNRGRDVLRQAAPALEVGYAGMAYQWRPGSKTTANTRAWTADLQADIYLCDVYSGKTFPAEATLPEHPGWARWYAEMIAPYPSRRWGIAERGILAGPTRAATIAREAEWLATSSIGQRCELYLWWNTGGTEANTGWVLDPAGQDAVAQLLERLATPVRFTTSDLDGVLICQAGGCLVSAELADRHGH